MIDNAEKIIKDLTDLYEQGYTFSKSGAKWGRYLIEHYNDKGFLSEKQCKLGKDVTRETRATAAKAPVENPFPAPRPIGGGSYVEKGFDGYTPKEKSFMVATIQRRMDNRIKDEPWQEFREALDYNAEVTDIKDHFNVLKLKDKWTKQCYTAAPKEKLKDEKNSLNPMHHNIDFMR